LTAVTFELARQFANRDHRSFFRHLLGRWWFLYEVFFAIGLLIVLSVCGAAAGAVLQDSFALPALLGIALMLVIVGVLNYFGRALVEKTLTAWGLAMSTVFVGFVLLTLVDRGEQIVVTFASEHSAPSWASRRSNLASSEFASRAVSPAKRFLPASRNSFDQR